ncbi:MAG: response regulator [Gammaproteobacteria bacterium]|nr:response regulator [Gammaproteobacteria bacterium]HJO11703.1 response regulator [Gammaproteobacteria bacterium]
MSLQYQNRMMCTVALNKISILLVDDHELFRSGIVSLLSEESDIMVVGEFGSGEEAVSFLRSNVPDIVLMDARMPGIGGIEATRQARLHKPQLKIIALSSATAGVIPSQMLRAGASAFITKNIGVDEMLKAIRQVNAGYRYITPEVAKQVALDPFNDDDKALFDKLSRRELQIAMLLTDGKKVSQIAGSLGLSPKTIYSYSYRYRIFEKLGIRSDVELTVLSVANGLTESGREIVGVPLASIAAS